MLRELRRRLLLCAGVCFCTLVFASARWRVLLCADVCFYRACCGVARAFLLASFQFASLQHDAEAPRFLWGGAFACGVDEVFRYNEPHD